MEQQQALFQVIGSCFLVWAAFVGTASVVVHLRVRWWQSQMGVHLLAYMLAVAAVLDLGVVKLIIGDSALFQLLRLITFISIPIVMSWRLLLQVQAQRAVRGAARGSGAAPEPRTPDKPDTPVS